VAVPPRHTGNHDLAGASEGTAEAQERAPTWPFRSSRGLPARFGSQESPANDDSDAAPPSPCRSSGRARADWLNHRLLPVIPSGDNLGGAQRRHRSGDQRVRSLLPMSRASTASGRDSLSRFASEESAAAVVATAAEKEGAGDGRDRRDRNEPAATS
jgi:hypothetical protein